MKRTGKSLVCVLLAILLALPMGAAFAEGKFTPGEYEGVARGMNGDVKVKVTLSDDKIESVEVLENQETYGIGQGLLETPIEVIPGKIVETQSIGVDMITGATISGAAVLGVIVALARDGFAVQ